MSQLKTFSMHSTAKGKEKEAIDKIVKNLWPYVYKGIPNEGRNWKEYLSFISSQFPSVEIELRVYGHDINDAYIAYAQNGIINQGLAKRVYDFPKKQETVQAEVNQEIIKIISSIHKELIDKEERFEKSKIIFSKLKAFGIKSLTDEECDTIKDFLELKKHFQ